MRRRRGLVLALFALAVVVVAVTSSLALIGTSGGPAHPAGSATASTTAAPSPLDVAAARACEAWNDYLSAALGGTVSSAEGQSLLKATEPLIAGAKQDEAEGRALPKWEALGGDIIDGADDVVNGNAEALQSDGAAVASQCKAIPAAAAAAGGYVSSSSSPPSS